MSGSIGSGHAYGLNDEYWKSLSDVDREMYRMIRPLPISTYSVQNPIMRIEETLATLDRDAKLQGGKLDLCPDFQRGHVWGREKQVAFIEAIVRGTAPMVIRFNSPGWERRADKDNDGGLNEHDVLCIDGLQRLTAIRQFIAKEFTIFGGMDIDALNETVFSFKRIRSNWTMEMFNIGRRDDLLQFYLDLNSGGVVHSDEELERVGKLLAEAREARAGEDPKPAARKPRKNLG